MTSEPLGWTSKYLRLCPRQSLSVKHVQVFEMFVPRVPSEEVKLVAKYGHCVRISGHRDHSRNLRLDPSHCIQVKYVNVVEALVTIVPAKHVQLSAHSAHGVTGSSGWLLATDLGLGPN